MRGHFENQCGHRRNQQGREDGKKRSEKERRGLCGFTGKEEGTETTALVQWSLQREEGKHRADSSEISTFLRPRSGSNVNKSCAKIKAHIDSVSIGAMSPKDIAPGVQMKEIEYQLRG